MDDLPWDLVFYGAMAISFIGIIAASRAARRKPPESAANSGGDGASPPARPDKGDSGVP